MDNIRHIFTNQVDGRRIGGRLYRKALDEIITELGGRDQIKPSQIQGARRLAALVVAADRYEKELIETGQVDVREQVAFTNCFLRTMRELGLLKQPNMDDDGLELEDLIDA